MSLTKNRITKMRSIRMKHKNESEKLFTKITLTKMITKMRLTKQGLVKRFPYEDKRNNYLIYKVRLTNDLQK